MTPDDSGESPQGHHANVTTLVQDVEGGGGLAVCSIHVSGQGLCANSILPAQLFCDPKTARKIKAY